VLVRNEWFMRIRLPGGDGAPGVTFSRPMDWWHKDDSKLWVVR
jgi:hypothetical protein